MRVALRAVGRALENPSVPWPHRKQALRLSLTLTLLLIFRHIRRMVLDPRRRSQSHSGGLNNQIQGISVRVGDPMNDVLPALLGGRMLTPPAAVQSIHTDECPMRRIARQFILSAATVIVGSGCTPARGSAITYEFVN